MIDTKLKNANILIVDDQEANIDVLVSLLEMQGYKNIKTTQDPRDVVDLFASFDPDLILLDLSMPYLSGFEVMEQLKPLIDENSYLPILVLTADVTSSAKQKALSGGASDFLTKPFDLIEVGLRIRNLLYISYLQKQHKDQNRLLEEKVKERTKELEIKNAELTLAKDRAEASDRLKGTFINNISHEIRTPLNGILGFGQILTDPDLTTIEREQYSDMLNDSSSRLVNTVTNIMDISLLTSGNQKVYKKEIAIEKEILNTLQKFNEACYKRNIELEIQIPFEISQLKINTDGELFSKILHQLIDNAVKFTSKGAVSFNAIIVDNYLQFSIKDTGIGISENYSKQIFNIFNQEDGALTRKYEGAGLGLSIAKGFVELLGGRIWFESQKGIGSTFYFTMPVEQKIISESSSAKNKEIVESAQQTILIVEDDDINFQYIKAILSHFNLILIRACNGIEAVNICLNQKEINLILMDLKMKEMDGYQATKKIKEFRNDIPIIAVTAYADPVEKEKAIDAGCDDFIIKPVKKDRLIKKIEEFGVALR